MAATYSKVKYQLTSTGSLRMLYNGTTVKHRSPTRCRCDPIEHYTISAHRRGSRIAVAHTHIHIQMHPPELRHRCTARA